MAEQASLTMELTREQQLELLAATGLLVKKVAIDADAVAAGGAVMAQVPLPRWLVREPVTR